MLTRDQLNEEQKAFWDGFPEHVYPNGEVRRQVALLRREWHYPASGNHGYRLLSDELTPDLDADSALCQSLLQNEEQLIAYAAKLRLLGA